MSTPLVEVVRSGVVESVHAGIVLAVRPDGSRLKPPMGTAYYARLSAADLDALVAYLRSLPPK